MSNVSFQIGRYIYRIVREIYTMASNAHLTSEQQTLIKLKDTVSEYAANDDFLYILCPTMVGTESFLKEGGQPIKIDSEVLSSTRKKLSLLNSFNWVNGDEHGSETRLFREYLPEFLEKRQFQQEQLCISGNILFNLCAATSVVENLRPKMGRYHLRRHSKNSSRISFFRATIFIVGFKVENGLVTELQVSTRDVWVDFENFKTSTSNSGFQPILCRDKFIEWVEEHPNVKTKLERIRVSSELERLSRKVELTTDVPSKHRSRTENDEEPSL